MVSLPLFPPDLLPKGGGSCRRASSQPRESIQVNHRMSKTDRRDISAWHRHE